MTPVIILAGGKSSRMGTDKTRLLYGGETLLERAVRRFSPRFEVLVSANRDMGIGDVRIINDVFPGLGPISGLHAALGEFESVFLLAADMPFACPEAAALIIEAGRGHAVCAAVSDNRPEPLFAYYTDAVMPLIKDSIETGDYSLHRLFKTGAKLVPTASDILMNINRPEDYEKLKSHIELGKT